MANQDLPTCLPDELVMNGSKKNNVLVLNIYAFLPFYM